MSSHTELDRLSDDDIDRYLGRLGLDRSGVDTDVDGLAELCAVHLERVPFENLDIVFAGGVDHDLAEAVAAVVDRGRGGWCFELNGAFATLLVALGFDVRLLGAAVLLDGPSTVLEHLALEVSGGSADIEPHLVDVGFGDSFVRPLRLNTDREQNGSNGTYALLPSPQGTTLTREVDGVPAAQYRFKRVAHDFADFGPVARQLQTDPTRKWSVTPFATRLLRSSDLDATPGRVTLRGTNLKVQRPGSAWVGEHTVAADEWRDVLAEYFPMLDPARWPPPT